MKIDRLMKNDDLEQWGWSKNFLRKVSRVYTRCQPVVFMGMFSLKFEDKWNQFLSPVFWQPDPLPGHTNYFAFLKSGGVKIVDGASAFSESFAAVVADDGEVIYSRYTHDHVTSQDGSVSIDGGREYVRTSRLSKFVFVEAQGANLVVIEK